MSLTGETNPVHHRTPQKRQEGDRGEPLPVSRATSGERSRERSASGRRVPQMSALSSAWALTEVLEGFAPAAEHRMLPWAGCAGAARAGPGRGGASPSVATLPTGAQEPEYRSDKHLESSWEEKGLSLGFSATALQSRGHRRENSLRQDLGLAVHFEVHPSTQQVSLEGAPRAHSLLFW